MVRMTIFIVCIRKKVQKYEKKCLEPKKCRRKSKIYLHEPNK